MRLASQEPSLPVLKNGVQIQICIPSFRMKTVCERFANSFRGERCMIMPQLRQPFASVTFELVYTTLSYSWRKVHDNASVKTPLCRCNIRTCVCHPVLLEAARQMDKSVSLCVASAHCITAFILFHVSWQGATSTSAWRVLLKYDINKITANNNSGINMQTIIVISVFRIQSWCNPLWLTRLKAPTN